MEKRKSSRVRYLWLLGFMFAMLPLFQSCDSKNSGAGAPEIAATACLEQFDSNNEWSAETEVEIDGYSDNAMEPKASADGKVLFWNNKPATGDEDMDIHYAVEQSNGRFLYIGVLPGSSVNSFLDGVPAIDSVGNFYFISTRTYTTNFQTIYGGQVNVLGANSLEIINVSSADANVTQNTNGKLDMDIDVSWDGTLMVASRARFAGRPFPEESYLDLFSVNNRQASPITNSDDTLKNINSLNCRIYAGNLSSDLLELYYTVIPKNSAEKNEFRIIVSKRNSVSDAFGPGSIISAITGEATEGPAISFDDKTLLFHKWDSASSRYKIYKVTRP